MSRDVVISVEEELLAEAKSRAASDHQTIDQIMCRLLAEYVERKDRVERHRELMQRLSYVSAGRKFTREEMNER